MPQRGPTTPILPKQYWFGLIPVRSPLLGESLLFSLPMGTKMFQFPTFASVLTDDRSSTCRVVPFGNLWITGYLLLPIAYRSLSRPSSPARAKASTVRPFLLCYANNYILYIAEHIVKKPFAWLKSYFLPLLVSSL